LHDVVLPEQIGTSDRGGDCAQTADLPSQNAAIRIPKGRSMAKLRRIAALATALTLASAGFLLTGEWEDSVSTLPDDRPLWLKDPAQRPLVIVAMGSSLTAWPDWPDKLGRALGTCPDLSVEIRRIAKPGAGSAWGLTRLEDPALQGANIVLVEFAINDADLRDGVSLRHAAAQHHALVIGLREANPGVEVALMTMNPAHGLRGWMRPHLAAHYRQYRQIAAELDTGLVDLWPRWLALPRAARGLKADGLHPEPEVAAQVMLPVLLPYLARAIGAKGCREDGSAR
jgi:acyl-CoA thioesterase I